MSRYVIVRIKARRHRIARILMQSYLIASIQVKSYVIVRIRMAWYTIVRARIIPMYVTILIQQYVLVKDPPACDFYESYGIRL
jgi:hypothetical protein